jgi:hypothetical protein
MGNSEVGHLKIRTVAPSPSGRVRGYHASLLASLRRMSIHGFNRFSSTMDALFVPLLFEFYCYPYLSVCG